MSLTAAFPVAAAVHTGVVETPKTDWFAVRCVFELSHDDRADSQMTSYEERVTLWQAQTFDHAIAEAEQEADSYARTVASRFLSFSQAYRLAETPGHGGEVFSLIRDSRLAPGDYVTAFFDTGDEHQGS